jgi:hypothetical protein
MIFLLRYGDYEPVAHDSPWATHTKHYQHIEMTRIAGRFGRPGGNVGEVGCKTNFNNLLQFRGSRHFVIDPYNGAPGAGPTEIPKLPYPIALFRCLVGPDSQIIPDQFFDLTLSISVIEHVGQQEAGFDCEPTSEPPLAQERLRDLFCQELFRTTRPGGLTFHTVDHAARNLSFLANFRKAGFELIENQPAPTVDTCLNDPDAVRQRVDWRRHDKPMPADQQRLHACLMMGFRRPG